MKKFAATITLVVIATGLTFLLDEDLNNTVNVSPVNKPVKSFESYLDSKQVNKSDPVQLEEHYQQFSQEEVTEEAIQDFYDSAENKFESYKAHVAHILIQTHKTMNAETRKAKYEQAYEAYSQLKQGADFAQIARTYSEDRLTANKGGDLGWIPQGMINPEFSNLAFNKLKVNEISKPFQSKFGFHIIKLVAEPVASKIPLKEVERFIRVHLQDTIRKERDQLIGNEALSLN